MDDALLVRLVQCVRDLDAVPEHLLDGQRTLFETSGQRFPVEILDDEVIDPVLVTDVVERADVRVRELRNGSSLSVEPLAKVLVRGEVTVENLQSDDTIEPRIASAVDLAHAAGTE
jgi:hypothetical protein